MWQRVQQACVAKYYSFDCRIIGQHRNCNFCAGYRLTCRFRDFGPVLCKCFCALSRAIEDGEIMSCFQQILRNWASHTSEPQKCNFHAALSPALDARSAEADLLLKMVSAIRFRGPPRPTGSSCGGSPARSSCEGAATWG